MIVPQFWAESQVQDRVKGRLRTVRRWGWSDESPEAAQAMADARAREAFERVSSGQRLPWREPKVAYNGAEGVPIREEVVGRHGDALVTRNSYGARCLNTPDVLFADVDFRQEPATALTCLLVLALPVCAGVVCRAAGLSWGLTAAAAVAGLPLGYAAAVGLHRLRLLLAGGAERQTRRRVEAFVAGHPGWLLRLYRTPAGFRVLAIHRTFRPDDQEAAELFRALDTDPVYVRMCIRQHCFRARLGPKPWRIGIAAHMKPRPGIWPVSPERMPDRARWIEGYEQAARGYAACRFVEALGSAMTVDAKAEAVRRVHDELARADSGLPIA